MLAKIKGIVIHTIPYSESSLVLRCYTNQFGMQSYMVSGLFGKKAAIKPAQLLPLNLLELDVYHQQSKNLQRIKELKLVPSLKHIHVDMQKGAIALFMAELLSKCIKEESESDPGLFEFIFSSVQILDLSEDSVANFPVYFMYRLCRYLGFDLLNASFMEDDLNRVFQQIGELNFQSLSTLSLNGDLRRQLLDRLTRYYQSHHLFRGDLKSPAILNEVLS